MANSPFTAVPAATASNEEQLAWLEQVRSRPPAEISANLYKIEEVYGRLPDTQLGAVTTCETRQAIQTILDQHAHCSVECGVCHQSHCLPRSTQAKQDLQAFATSIGATTKWDKDSDPHMKVLNQANEDKTAKGSKSALNSFRENMDGGVMIGALRCTDSQGRTVTIYASTGSMPKIPEGQQMATKDSLKFAPPINANGDYRVASGAPVKVSQFRGHGNPPGACAAQRALQQALALGLTPVSLAESWFGSSKDGDPPRVTGHMYASCPTCRNVLATVLCPNRPSPPPAPSTDTGATTTDTGSTQ